MSFTANSKGGKYNHSHKQTSRFGAEYVVGTGYKYSEGEAVINNDVISTSEESGIPPYEVPYIWKRIS